MVFQNPDDQLVASLIENDVAFGPENLGVPTDQLRQRVADALADVGLQGFDKRETAALSGGQKQRVAIAGVLAMEPAILILDAVSYTHLHDDLAFALLLALRLEIVERPHVGERLGVDEIGWPWKAPNCIEGARLSAQRFGAIRAPRTTVADRTHLLPPVRKKRGRFSRNSRASIIRGIVGKGNPQSSVRFVLAPNKRQRRRARLTRRTRLPYTEAKRRAEARSEEGMGDFSDRVFEVVRRIPRGKVATYGQVGRLIGAPRSARYVGYALRANPEPGAEVNSIPCHRVVFKDGGLCKGFAFGGPEVQREMLEAEGVAFADDAHVDMGACLWDGRMDDADDPTLPMAPPEDFDWERELGA